MSDQEAVVETETVETQEPGGGEGAEPAPTDPAPAADAEFSLDDDGVSEILKDVPKKGGVATREFIRELAMSNPNAAHILDSMFKDYKKKTGSVAEERRKLAEEKKSIEAMRRQVADENRRFQEAVLSSGLGADMFKMPEAETPSETDKPDWSALVTDPEAFAKKIEENAYKRALADFNRELPSRLKPLTDPLTNLHDNVRKQASLNNVQKTIAAQGEHWTGIKPIVDRLLEADKNLTFDVAVRLGRGEYFEGLHKKAGERTQRRDREQVSAAVVSSRGTGGKGTISMPDTVRGGSEISAWIQSQLEAGHSLEDVQEFMRQRAAARS